MAVYKIFSEKDTFISSYRLTQNFGRDEILEISNDTQIPSSTSEITRALIQFSNSQISNTLTNIVSGSWKSYLKLFLADATIPIDYTLFFYPISQSWDMGLGRSGDDPITTEGCTWVSRTQTQNWATSGSSFITNTFSTQSFNYLSDKDINVDITTIVSSWYSSSIPNNGILIKHSSSVESSTNQLVTKFFSMDTHTIYHPQLEFRWDDSSYSTTLTQLTTSDFIPVISNNRAEFEENTVYTFRIKSRDRYPARAFTTTSVYLNTKALPSTTYWALKDVKTEEMVIDFDTNYTKVSCDNTSNYFKLYMNGLEPERYYQILIKTILSNGETLIIDNPNNYFKIVK